MQHYIMYQTLPDGSHELLDSGQDTLANIQAMAADLPEDTAVTVEYGPSN